MPGLLTEIVMTQTEDQMISDEAEDQMISEEAEDQMISEEIKPPDYEYKDGGWAWVVTLACFVSFLLVTSFPKTAGIFYAHMLEEFNIPLPSLTTIGSTNSAISFVGG